MGVSRNNGKGVRKTRADLAPRTFKGRVFPDRAKLEAGIASGLRHGYRSGLELKNAEHLQRMGVDVSFETIKIKYSVPETSHTYTPDFTLPNGILVETKGKLEPKDRAKHKFVKFQNPLYDIRFVFMRPNDRINKGSPTTYAMWAEKEGFKWAARLIPSEWLKEPGPEVKPWDL